jgi:glutamate N-acetyltransferase/amino-acid N-acetyltransferase
MAVGSSVQEPVLPVDGIRLAAVKAGIRYADRLDLVLIELCAGATTAGVFTQNAFCAAPVHVARTHLLETSARYFLINTGNANAGTGKTGMQDAEACCASVAELTQVPANAVLPFSTGVIGEPLPTDKIVAGIPVALESLHSGAWISAAEGIMTTDTRPKAVSESFELNGTSITISGIAKGAGMLKPDMATMLAFVGTDAQIEAEFLQSLLKQVVDRSFNRITVDGDTSTNDCCMLTATGKSGVSVSLQDPDLIKPFLEKLDLVFNRLATGLIRDAEGATKTMQVKIVGGADSAECLSVAYAIAESPLVKTALFAADPNWGRILAAVGRAGIGNLVLEKVNIHLGSVCLVHNGELSASYSEKDGQAQMDKDEVNVTVSLNRGDAEETVWTSDLSHEYIRINAEYRT